MFALECIKNRELQLWLAFVIVCLFPPLGIVTYPKQLLTVLFLRALILKMEPNDLFRQNTTTYTIISIQMWLHVSVPS